MDQDFQHFESSLRELARPGAPPELRGRVLRKVHRQLRGERWEWRAGGFAALLLIAGIGLNLTVTSHRQESSGAPTDFAGGPQALIEVAMTVAQATDPETASRMAQQLVALSGAVLSPEQVATLDRAIHRHTKNTVIKGGEG